MDDAELISTLLSLQKLWFIGNRKRSYKHFFDVQLKICMLSSPIGKERSKGQLYAL